MALLLLKAVDGKGVEFPGKENIVESGGDIAPGSLPVEAELLIGGLRPTLAARIAALTWPQVKRGWVRPIWATRRSVRAVCMGL